MSWGTLDVCKTKEYKQTEVKMNNSKNSTEEEMLAGVRSLIVVNHKYKKIICMGKLCGKAIKAVNLRKHLQGRHRIGISVVS